MRSRLAAGRHALVLVIACIGCRDVPLFPHWGADWNVPLPTQDISLFGPFGWSVPAGSTASIGFPPQELPLTGTIGSLLDQQLSRSSVVLAVTKGLPVSAIDTVFVAAGLTDLSDETAARIVIPITVAATALTLTDTITVTTAGLAMLRTVAAAGGSVWVQLRGQVTFAGPGTLTVTPADSVHVRLSLLATIAVSR